MEASGGDVRDRQLLRAHLAGDPDAFGALAHRHSARLFAVAMRTLGDREEAADAVQDALIRAFRKADTFRGEARVSTWLHRIVINACLDRARRQAVRRTVPLPEHEPADTRDALVDRERTLDVQAALAGLPSEQRVAIVLVDLQGMPVAEAAAVLGVPAGTIKSRCSRGRARLSLTLGHLARNPDRHGGVEQTSGEIDNGHGKAGG